MDQYADGSGDNIWDTIASAAAVPTEAECLQAALDLVAGGGANADIVAVSYKASDQVCNIERD